MWTKKEHDKLIQLYKVEKLTIKEVAKNLGRTTSAVASYIKRNNLSNRTNKKKHSIIENEVQLNIETEIETNNNDVYITMKNTYEKRLEEANKIKKGLEEIEALKKKQQEEQQEVLNKYKYIL